MADGLHLNQLLKEQRKYDEMVFDLALGIESILPFSKQALEGVLVDETEVTVWSSKKDL